jgi:hypothetical protein
VNNDLDQKKKEKKKKKKKKKKERKRKSIYSFGKSLNLMSSQLIALLSVET